MLPLPGAAFPQEQYQGNARRSRADDQTRAQARRVKDETDLMTARRNHGSRKRRIYRPQRNLLSVHQDLHAPLPRNGGHKESILIRIRDT